ncbi:uncharacterized protein Triagg1_6817 [Trichoderma aggressivum f. europaeum]|uniref:Ankyrin repeat protein n=1 Tax=Trichoderma aggressivum f. europaeum TaxID=173218 RepID=A0AAE1LZ33_9HYPO|nr:hypothetical protein Triagg1_6817 [Trichoderma aggressivum f. europaeum]
MMKRLRVLNPESFDDSNQPVDDIVLILEAWSAAECENDDAAEAFSSHTSKNSRISQFFLRMDDTQNGIYTSEGVQAEAAALLECILELRRHDTNVFVCTLGRWQDEDDLKKALRQILASRNGMEDTAALHHLQGLADVVIEANNAFHESKGSLGDIYSVLPSDSTTAEASISRTMCCVYHPLEILGMTITSSGEMMEILANSTLPIFRSERDQRAALCLNPYLQAALSYAAPQPPFPYITDNTTDGVSNEAWLEWIHSEGYFMLFIHNHGRKLFELCLRFIFKLPPIQFAKCALIDMAIATLVQMRHLDAVGSVYRLGDEDLFRICVCSLKDNLSANKNLTALFVLNNLDAGLTWQTWLVKKLHEAFQDSQLRLKVLITSPRIDLVRESLGFAQECSPITIALAPVSSKILAAPESDETSPEAQELQSIDIAAWHIVAKYHPPLQHVRSKLASLAPWLREVTYRWIEENSNHTGIKDIINDFLSSANDYEVIRMIFNSFSEKKFLAMSVMTIILWGMRPLNKREFVTLLDVAMNTLTNTTVSTYEEAASLFHGLVTTQRDHVCLASNMIREALQSPSEMKGVSWWKDERECHAALAGWCLDYLQLSTSQDVLNNTHGREMGIFGRDQSHSLLWYAVDYWVEHARRSGGRWSPKQRSFQALLANEESGLSLWADAKSMENHPLVSTKAGRNSALSILAQYDLLSAIEVVIDAAGGQNVSEENLAAAFTAAAASGHLKIVRAIAQQARLQRYDADKAILAAIESGVDEVLEEVIGHCTRTGQVFSDVVAFLCRAASLNNPVAIKIVEEKVIKHKSLDDSVKSSFPLGLACYTKTPDILLAMLQLGISPPINHTESWRQPLDIICRYGSSAVIEPFLNHLKSAHAPESEFLLSICLDSLKIAEEYGQSAVISCILDWASRNSLVLINENVDSWTVFLSVPKYIKLLISPVLRPDNVTTEDTAFKKLLYAFFENKVIEVVQELLRPPITIDEDVFCYLLKEAGYRANEKLLNIACSVGARSGIDINSPSVKKKNFTGNFIKILTIFGLMAQLLEHKFDPNMEIPSLGRSILGHAAYRRRFKAVRALLAAGAKVDVGGDDWTPLHCAYDSPEITILLLKYGAQVDLKDKQNLSALYFASKWGHCEVVKAILEKMPRRDTLEQALSIALGTGQTEIAKILIDHDPDLTVESSDARRWLEEAASRSGGAAHIQLILHHCRNLDFIKGKKWSIRAMFRISRSTEVSTIRTLAANGADVNVRSTSKKTPLWYAALADNLDVARCLVRWGAKINSLENEPLVLNRACRYASSDFVRFLLSEGADVNITNSENPGTPLHSALLRNEDGKTVGKSQILDCLLNTDGIDVQIKSRTWGSTLSLAAMKCKPEVVTRLLEMGAVANDSDHLGREPIHFALLQSVEMAELLLREKGVTLDGKDKIGRHALHFAVQSRRLDVVKFVLRERPQFLNEPDIHGWTPLLWALRSLSPICVPMSEDQLKDILELLINQGASKFVKGKGAHDEFWTPVKLASYSGLDVLDILRPSPEELKRCDDESKDLWYEECDRRGTYRRTAYCDVCLAHSANFFLIKRGVGIDYECQETVCAADFYLCWKCALSPEILHPGHENLFCPYGEETSVAKNPSTISAENSQGTEDENADQSSDEDINEEEEDEDEEEDEEDEDEEEEEEEEEEDEDEDEDEEENGQEGSDEETSDLSAGEDSDDSG